MGCFLPCVVVEPVATLTVVFLALVWVRERREKRERKKRKKRKERKNRKERKERNKGRKRRRSAIFQCRHTL